MKNKEREERRPVLKTGCSSDLSLLSLPARAHGWEVTSRSHVIPLSSSGTPKQESSIQLLRLIINRKALLRAGFADDFSCVPMLKNMCSTTLGYACENGFKCARK
ncbi:hypothetical protein CDAR_521561 [Caerostris darwini]|uniref:Uncharacterized protein n=1 Tax=Caerostris darwini TaxID=1538125 RepID=A0AAV4ST06_9ARAC|nr:hypothetical protein CDAR_521561 [Caerostris darwini]